MNDKQLQINYINRKLGTLFTILGVKKLRDAQSEFTTIDTSNSKIYQALKNIGITLNFSPKDIKYRYTSWENWKKILDIIAEIIKPFPWEACVFDCDNRADFCSAFCSLVFRINTLGKVYCEVFDAETGKSLYLHWANLLVDIDDNIYLFDLDNNFMYQKITSASPVMNGKKYKFFQLVIN